MQFRGINWPRARANKSAHSTPTPLNESRTKHFHVLLPSHRKVDGHVWYRLEVRAVQTNALLNHECEKRLSEIRNFKNRVEQIMSSRAYNLVIKAAFPGSGFMGTSARLETWLNEVVSHCDNPQYPELLSLVFNFLNIRASSIESSKRLVENSLRSASQQRLNTALRPFHPFEMFRSLTAKSGANVRRILISFAK